MPPTKTGEIGEVDLSGVSSDIPVLPDAEYVLRLFDVKLTQVQGGDNAGADMFNFQWRTDAEFHPGQKNRTVFDNVPVIAGDGTDDNRGTLWRLVKIGEVLGIINDTNKKVSYPKFVEAKGKRIVARVGSKERGEEYGGGKSNVIRAYKPFDAAKAPSGTAKAAEVNPF